jgi:pyrroloquinoline quinone (PQQ) biosynthesis protein C
MMLAASDPEELLALDDLEPWADPAAHPVFEKVASGLASRETVRRLVLALYPAFTGRSRYAPAARVSRISLEDGRTVFADLHRALTVPAADADAGWGAVAAALGVSQDELEDARAGGQAEAEDLVAIIRQHGLRSAHEAVGVAWVLDRRLPGLFGALADALATHYGVAEEALSHLRYRAAGAREAEARVRHLVESYLSEPWGVYEARRAAREVLWDLTALFETVSP